MNYKKYVYDYCTECINLGWDECICEGKHVWITPQHIDKCINDNLYEER